MKHFLLISVRTISFHLEQIYNCQRHISASGLVHVLVVVTQLPRQLMDHLLEDHRVDVEPDHVQQEEVAHLGLFDNDIDALLLDQSKSDVQEICLTTRKSFKILFEQNL